MTIPWKENHIINTIKKGRNTGIAAGGSIILSLIILAKGIPLFNGIILAFKRFEMFKGIHGSNYVGLRNFTQMLNSFGFSLALTNTIRMNLIYIFLIGILSFILAFSLVKIDRRLQNFFLALILIPLFIPGTVIAHAAFKWFEGTTYLMDTKLFPYVYASLNTVKFIGIPTLFILKTRQREGCFTILRAPLLFFLVQITFILSTDFDILNTIINPLVYESGSTLDHLYYKSGIMMMKAGETQVIWLLQLLVHSILAAAAYLIMHSLYRQKKACSLQSQNSPSERFITAGLVAPVIYALFIVVFVFKPLLYNGVTGLASGLPPLPVSFLKQYLIYILVFGITASLGFGIMLILGRCAGMEGIFGTFTRIVLIFMLIAGSAGIHNYLFIKGLNLTDTYLSFVLYYLFPIAGSLVLGLASAGKTALHGNAEGFGFVRSAFLLALLQFIIMWNSIYPMLLFTSRPEMFHPMMLIHQMTGQRGPDFSFNVILGYDLLMAVLPVSIFLIFRKHFGNILLLAYSKDRF